MVLECKYIVVTIITLKNYIQMKEEQVTYVYNVNEWALPFLRGRGGNSFRNMKKKHNVHGNYDRGVKGFVLTGTKGNVNEMCCLLEQMELEYLSQPGLPFRPMNRYYFMDSMTNNDFLFIERCPEVVNVKKSKKINRMFQVQNGLTIHVKNRTLDRNPEAQVFVAKVLTTTTTTTTTTTSGCLSDSVYEYNSYSDYDYDSDSDSDFESVQNGDFCKFHPIRSYRVDFLDRQWHRLNNFIRNLHCPVHLTMCSMVGKMVLSPNHRKDNLKRRQYDLLTLSDGNYGKFFSRSLSGAVASRYFRSLRETHSNCKWKKLNKVILERHRFRVYGATLFDDNGSLAMHMEVVVTVLVHQKKGGIVRNVQVANVQPWPISIAHMINKPGILDVKCILGVIPDDLDKVLERSIHFRGKQYPLTYMFESLAQMALDNKSKCPELGVIRINMETYSTTEQCSLQLDCPDHQQQQQQQIQATLNIDRKLESSIVEESNTDVKIPWSTIENTENPQQTFSNVVSQIMDPYLYQCFVTK